MSEKMLIHRVPVFTKEKLVTRMRYFRTVTEAKWFAREQCNRLGHKGWTMESLPAARAIELLEFWVPIPDHYFTERVHD